MVHFWEFNAWGFVSLLAVLFGSLLLANLLKKSIGFLRKSLIPTSVLGGLILLIVATVYHAISGDVLFDTAFFGGNGSSTLEILTYHTLALGFIASSLKTTDGVKGKKRAVEVFNAGVTTVSTYLLQGVLGLGITLLIALGLPELFSSAGIILPFGFGQGTGQALNYGTIYEEQFGFSGGAHFGLTIAAMGFLSASLGGVIHLNILKRKGVNIGHKSQAENFLPTDIQHKNEVPMNGSIDKLTLQIAIVFVVYMLAYSVMLGVGSLVGDDMKATIYGFNFLFGVLFAVAVKGVLKFLNKKNIVKKQYINNFCLTRISNFCFDIMIVAGIAVIRLDYIKEYWWIILILAVFGLVSTYLYNYFIAKKFYPEYAQEQFLAMYGMLTGTASTGIILLREIDQDFKTPASDNLIYQTLPAIVFGFPIMLIAPVVPNNPLLYLGILAGFFVVMNIILFRQFIFRRKQKSKPTKTIE